MENMVSRAMLVAPMVLIACVSSATKPAPSNATAKHQAQKTQETPNRRTSASAQPTPACTDALKDAIEVGQLGDEKGVPYVMPIDLSLDLDGDGKPDRVLELDRDGTTVRYELYVQHGKCAEKVGSLAVPGTLSLGRGVVNGMRVLEVEGLCLEGCCRSIQHEEIVFDGEKWVPRRSWYVPRNC